jgi:hypothetical protein
MKTRTNSRPTVTLQPASIDSPADLLSGLKKSVSQRLTREFRQCVPVVVIRRAVDDAAEIARSTDFPHLFFPSLAEEKVRLVSAAFCDETAPAELIHSAA